MSSRGVSSPIRPSGPTRVVIGVAGIIAWLRGVVRVVVTGLVDVGGAALAVLGVLASVGFGRARGYVEWREQTATGDRAVTFGERAGLLWHYSRWVYRIGRVR